MARRRYYFCTGPRSSREDSVGNYKISQEYNGSVFGVDVDDGGNIYTYQGTTRNNNAYDDMNGKNNCRV